MGNFIDKIKDRARADVKTIVMPESNDRRVLIAAAKILEEGIAKIIMRSGKDYGWCWLA